MHAAYESLLLLTTSIIIIYIRRKKLSCSLQASIDVHAHSKLNLLHAYADIASSPMAIYIPYEVLEYSRHSGVIDSDKSRPSPRLYRCHHALAPLLTMLSRSCTIVTSVTRLLRPAVSNSHNSLHPHMHQQPPPKAVTSFSFLHLDTSIALMRMIKLNWRKAAQS